MENEPDTDNVVYIDEFKRERWLHNLRVSRELGQLALFPNDPAQLMLFPEQEVTPDDIA